MEIKITETNGILLYRNLCEAASNKMFHEKHSIPLSHPADILYKKFNALSDKLIRLIETRNSDIYENDKIENTKSFILEMDSFYDSLLLIIKCFTEPNGTDNRDVTKWLSKNYQYNKFKDSTSSHHETFRKMSNVIKHDDIEFTLLTVVNHNEHNVAGFYIKRAVSENDLRGSCRTIHSVYKKNNKENDTAFSYNHFILHSIGCIFHYMDKLNSILFDKAKSQSNKKFTEPLRVLKAAQEIEQQFYPDEYKRPYALIKEVPYGSSINFPFRYAKRPSEDFDNIKSFAPCLFFNQRTGKAADRLPYFHLIYR
jgi:hypothetical protein